MSNYIHILHITRFAKWLEEEGCSISQPYLLTMGGTDIHVDLKQGSVSREVYQLIENASAITLFNAEAITILNDRVPNNQKYYLIPQGIVLPPYDESKDLLTREEAYKWGYHIVLPAGLRKVKDVLHLLPAWIDLSTFISNFKVTIIGEVLEDEVNDRVQEAVKNYPFLIYRDAVDFLEMGKIYSEADIIINTSQEEGQPTAICEAMGLGIPVIVRENGGNCSVVQNKKTGYVYKQPHEFVELVKDIINNEKKTKEMVKEAKRFIREERTVEQEVEAYIELLTKF